MKSRYDIDAIIEKVNRSDLSTIRSVVVKLLAIVEDPGSTAKDLVELIHTDPPLAAKVLQTVNSAHCSPVAKISDLQQAVIFIGFEALKELALNQKVCELFQRPIKISGYSRKALWRHSVAVALCAKQIYRKEYGEKGEIAYASGILHDIGIIVEDQFLNDEFRNVLADSSGGVVALRAAERSRMGFDHAELGMRLMENWDLPHSLTVAIGHHHDPNGIATEDDQRLAATCYVANQCCQREGIGYCNVNLLDEDLLDQCLATIRVPHHAIELIVEDVKAQIALLEAQGLV